MSCSVLNGPQMRCFPSYSGITPVGQSLNRANFGPNASTGINFCSTFTHNALNLASSASSSRSPSSPLKVAAAKDQRRRTKPEASGWRERRSEAASIPKWEPPTCLETRDQPGVLAPDRSNMPKRLARLTLNLLRTSHHRDPVKEADNSSHYLLKARFL